MDGVCFSAFKDIFNILLTVGRIIGFDLGNRISKIHWGQWPNIDWLLISAEINWWWSESKSYTLWKRRKPQGKTSSPWDVKILSIGISCLFLHQFIGTLSPRWLLMSASLILISARVAEIVSSQTLSLESMPSTTWYFKLCRSPRAVHKLAMKRAGTSGSSMSLWL